MTYGDLQEAIDYVNGRPRPLALYYFGDDEAERNRIIRHTWSGNIGVNDVVAQGLREEIPYGGVGSSGIGCYKGIDGFRNFSHAKPIFYQTGVDEALAPLRPPYSDGVRAFVDGLLKGP
jgi:coniferyl-aldehyde dehydrogenase